ncbi:MAG: EAL domain-containing protein [Acidimicrobiales bacterium]
MADATPVDPEVLDDLTCPLWDELLVRAISGEGVRAVFQPIVDLPRRVVAGFEALTRIDLVDRMGPDRWFAAAASHNLVAELETATLNAAMSHRHSLPPNTFLSVNVEPESLLSSSVLDALHAAGPLGGLVVEVTEHRPLGDLAAVGAALDHLKAEGALIAVDDAGAGYAGLQQVLTMRPSIIKLDRSLVDGVDRDGAKTALVEMLGVFASRIDAWLLAEGVETLGEARHLDALGVPLAQGYAFARPSPPWCDLDHDLVAGLGEAHDRRSDDLSPLVESVPSVGHADIDSAFEQLASGRADLVVVVDRDRRPVGVIDSDRALAGTSGDAIRANRHSGLAEVAHRLATRVPVDTSTPILVTDDAGTYVGIVRIHRLLAALAGSA